MPEYKNKVALSGIILLIALSVFSFSSFHLTQIFQYDVLFYQRLGVPKAIITYLLIAVSNIVYFNVLGKGEQFKIDKLDLIFFSYLSIIFISVFVATERSTAIAAFFFHLNIFLAFLLFKAIFARHYEHSKKILYWAITLGSLFLVGLYLIHNGELLQGLVGEEFKTTYQAVVKKTRSLVGAKNQTGSFAVLCMFFIWYLKPDAKYNYYTAFVTIVLIGLILVIGSRNAWVASILMALITFFYINPSRKRLFQLGTIMLVLIGLFFSTINLKLLTRHLQHNTLISRFKTWTNSFEMFQMNPLIGNGVGQFPILKADFELANIIHPHNDIVSAMVETGIIGMSLFLLLIGTISYIALQCLIKDKARAKEEKIYLLFVLMFGYLSLQMLDQFKYKMNHQLILIFIFAYIAKHGLDYGLLKQYAPPKIKVITATLLSLLMFGYMLVLSNNFYKLEGIKYVDKNDIEARMEAFKGINKNIIGLHRKKPIDNEIAHLYGKQKKWDKYYYHLKEAEKRYPYNAANLYNLERWFFRKKEYDTSLDYYLLETKISCANKGSRIKIKEYDALNLSKAQKDRLYSIDCFFIRPYKNR